MRELKDAFMARLTGDAQLVALATGGIHSLAAPAGAQVPHVLVRFQESAAAWLLQQKAYEDFDVHVEAVDEGPGQADIEAIKARLRALLDGQPLAVTGHTVWKVRCTGELADHTEVAGSQTLQHGGLAFLIRLA